MLRLPFDELKPQRMIKDAHIGLRCESAPNRRSIGAERLKTGKMAPTTPWCSQPLEPDVEERSDPHVSARSDTDERLNGLEGR